MIEIKAFSPVTGAVIATARIRTGSESGARRVPVSFARACEGAPSYRITAYTKRGPEGRSLVKRGTSWYTRVVSNGPTYKAV